MAIAAGILTLAIFVMLVIQARPLLTADISRPIEAYNVTPAAPSGAVPASRDAPALAPEISEGSPAEVAEETQVTTAPIAISLPKLAYAYKLGFRLPGDRIAAAQGAHRKLCTDMGPARCQLVAMERGSADDIQASAFLRLRVDSGQAGAFSDAAVRAVAQAGGRTIATSVTAEDVSKDIVDAEARIRQRELLVSRLTEMLRTRAGRVSELLEAERSVAQAQEELDQAKGWLAELRARVATSEFEIRYQAVAVQATPRVAGSQLGEAVRGSGAAFIVALRSLLTLLIYLAPWLLLAVPPLLILLRRTRRAAEASKSAEPEAGEEQG
ncbi:DUF4349 domain-containing protein [Sphingomonas canadensis]|uniref:DUF4349 domain-containing protein n=1 Tax=Sphingomonas canadensis TaxID=1219257 RepID=A0ABW3HBG1_9SPHN|nr:DUF4349 domain-containing protein [Sphingomonas canadensis]MCW3838448.1 DUF4349 domain-containing protein [Sphingomonas canadensis]